MINNGIVTKGVGVRELSHLLGSKMSVGHICTSANINKWAKFKPQRGLGIGAPLLVARKQKYMGLSPLVSSKLKAGEWRNGTAFYTPEQVRSDIKEWSYDKVGNTELHSLGHFLNGDDINGQGYNHNALPPDAGWSDITLTLSLVNNVGSGSNVVGYNSVTKEYTPKVTCRKSNFTAAFSDSSIGWIGANSDYMPLTWVVGDDTVGTDDWRFGIAVYVPYLFSNTVCNKWMVYVSDKPLRSVVSASDIGSALPDLATNQYLARCLAYCRSSKNVSEFECVPCLVKNSTNYSMGDSEGNAMTYVSLVNATVYSMPSGSGAFKLNVTSASTMPTISILGKDITAKYRLGTSSWYLFEVPTGGNVGSPHYYPVHHIVMMYVTGNESMGWRNVASTSNKNCYGLMSYSYFVDKDATSKTNANITGTGIDTIVKGNAELLTGEGGKSQTIYGKILVTRIAATINVSATNLS